MVVGLALKYVHRPALLLYRYPLEMRISAPMKSVHRYVTKPRTELMQTVRPDVVNISCVNSGVLSDAECVILDCYFLMVAVSQRIGRIVPNLPAARASIGPTACTGTGATARRGSTAAASE